MNWRGLLTLTILLAAAAGSWILFRLSDEPVGSGKDSPEDMPGYYLKNAQILGTAQDGQMLYRVEADDIRHVPAEDVVHLTSVRVRYAGEGDAAWTVTAQEGRIEGTGTFIQLKGDVLLETMLAPSRGNVVIMTQTLSFDPREQVARTEDEVRIEQPGYVLTAKGLEADMKKELLRLESNVSGIFKP